MFHLFFISLIFINLFYYLCLGFGKETSKRFQTAGVFGTGSPAYWYRIKELEDKLRYYVLFAIYTTVVIPLINFMSWLAPYGNVSKDTQIDSSSFIYLSFSFL